MLLINGNGSKWAGSSEDPIEKLYEMLELHPLDRVFERYGNFIQVAPRVCLSLTRDPMTGIQTAVEGGLMYSENPHTQRFQGNFLTISHGFCIDTDEPGVIDKLTRMIRGNQQRADYLSQKAPEPRPVERVLVLEGVR